jgi:hypothetical protein
MFGRVPMKYGKWSMNVWKNIQKSSKYWTLDLYLICVPMSVLTNGIVSMLETRENSYKWVFHWVDNAYNSIKIRNHWKNGFYQTHLGCGKIEGKVTKLVQDHFLSQHVV